MIKEKRTDATARQLFRVAIVVTVVGDAEDAREDVTGVGLFRASDEFGRSLGDDAPAAFTAFGAEVDDPVSLFDDVEMVLDDQHGVAEIDEALQDVEKFSHVVEMEARGGYRACGQSGAWKARARA